MPRASTPSPPNEHSRHPLCAPRAGRAAAGATATPTASLMRGLAVLAAFGPQDPALGHVALVQRTGLPRSTVSRLCATLLGLGWLCRDAQGRYRPSLASLPLAQASLHRLALPALARPSLQQLADRIHGVVALVVAHQGHALFLATVAAEGVQLQHPDAGHRLPLLALPAGRALLPWLAQAAPPDQVQAAVDELRRKGHCTAAHLPGPHATAIGLPLMLLPDGSADDLPVALHCQGGGPAGARSAAEEGLLALATVQAVRRAWAAGQGQAAVPMPPGLPAAPPWGDAAERSMGWA